MHTPHQSLSIFSTCIEIYASTNNSPVLNFLRIRSHSRPTLLQEQSCTIKTPGTAYRFQKEPHLLMKNGEKLTYSL